MRQQQDPFIRQYVTNSLTHNEIEWKMRPKKHKSQYGSPDLQCGTEKQGGMDGQQAFSVTAESHLFWGKS